MAGSAVATTSSRKGKGIVRVNVALTCVSGAISAQPIGSFYGRLVGIYTDETAGAGASMTTTADVLLTDATTGAAIISDLTFGTKEYKRPTIGISDTAGVLITAAATAADTNRDIFVAGKLNLAIANATTTDTGLISFVFDEG